MLGDDLDWRSDIFSFGTLLYELATGRRPFQGATVAATMAKILRAEPEPLAELRPGLPKDIEAILRRCFQREAIRRYASPRELVDDLRKLGYPLSSRSAAPMAPLVQPGALTPARPNGGETGVRLLLVEDEPALARGLADNFGAKGYAVRVVARGDEVSPAVREFRPDVIVLDIMLPGRSGLDVLRELRTGGESLPVLLLTAKGDIVDRVVGLELGADDYLPKPFAVRELLARVRALLRRAGGRGPAADRPAPAASEELILGGVKFDFRARTAARLDGRPVELSAHHVLVLRVLVERRGEVVPRIDIVEEVCGMSSEATLRTVDNHIVALRRAIRDDPRRPRWLHTVRGEGYRLTAD